jgi:hypothetical protein
MPGKSQQTKGRGAAIRDQKLALWRDKGKAVDIRKAAGRIPVDERKMARRITPASKGRSG